MLLEHVTAVRILVTVQFQKAHSLLHMSIPSGESDLQGAP